MQIQTSSTYACLYVGVDMHPSPDSIKLFAYELAGQERQPSLISRLNKAFAKTSMKFKRV